MKFLLAFSLTLLMITGCSLKPPDSRGGFSRQRHSANSPENNRLKNNAGKNTLRTAESGFRQGRFRTSSLSSADQNLLLPTLTHINDGSLMVLVNPGEHLVGLVDLNRGTLRPETADATFASLPPFYIDRVEITVEQYKKFAPQYDEKQFTGGKECGNCPAMAINWIHAYRYCQWAGKHLPSEIEWMAAARGRSGNIWPWGNQFFPERANLLGEKDGARSAAPAGSYPQGASPYGALDMAGNVWEWVSTPYSPPQQVWNTRPLRIVKGGGWTSDDKAAKISFRNIVDADLKNPTFGFRCAKSLEEKKSPEGQPGEKEPGGKK